MPTPDDYGERLARDIQRAVDRWRIRADELKARHDPKKREAELAQAAELDFRARELELILENEELPV